MPHQDPAPDVTRRQQLVHRVRYRFDNLLARGTWAVLLWLAAVTLAVVLISAVLLTLVGLSFTSDEGTTLQEDFWQSLLRVIDPGTMAGDVGWGRRILALVVTVFGLLVAGTLIGILAAGVEDRIADMRRGRSVVMEEDHVVVLGPSRRSAAVVVELLRGTAAARGGLVAMDDDDPAVLRDAVRTLEPIGLGEFVVRAGDPAAPSDLALVRLEAARAIVVVGDDDTANARVVLAVRAVLGLDLRAPVVVELSHPGRALALSDALGPDVHALPTELAVARIAAFAVSHPGLTHVVEEIIDPRGAQLQVVDATPHVGRTFGALVAGSRRGRPIAVVDGDGRVELAPSFDRAIAPGDEVVTLAASPHHLEIADELPPVEVARSRPVPSTTSAAQHLLVVGMTDLGWLFLSGWAQLAGPGSTITIAHEPGADRSLPPSLAHGNVTVRQLHETWREALPALAEGSLDATCVALLATPDADPAAVDTTTILRLITMQRQIPADRRPQFVVELVDPGSHALLPPLMPDDHVISRSLAAQMLTQLVDEPRRRDVLLALYDSAGPSLRRISPAELGIGRPTTWSDVVERCVAAGIVPVGWTSPEATELDPPPHSALDPASGLAIVVVA